MFKLKSVFEMEKYLDEKGYDIFIDKQDNGVFKSWVWHFDNCLGIGKFEYNTYEDARNTTLNNIYRKISVK